MSDIAISASVPSRKWLTWIIGALAALVMVGGYAAYLKWAGPADTPITSGDFYTVEPMDLTQHIVKDGELDAVDNIDILCLVEGQNVINTVVTEGTFVHKGDVLVRLDSSAIQQKIDDTALSLQTAESDLTAAQEAKEIQQSQNDANLDAAVVTLEIAKLDIKQYVEGTYPQSEDSAKTDLEMAKITLRNAEEDLANTKSLYAKGFVTGADIEKSELAVTTAQNGVNKAQTALTVLTKYTHAEDLANKQSAAAQAQKSLLRTKQQNLANLEQKVSDLNSKTQALALMKRRMEHYQEQFTDCTIKAPADGLVIYGTSNDRHAQNPIQDGAQVRERQPLLRLPDTSRMKAVIRVQEGMVGQLKLGQRATVTTDGDPVPIGATVTKISVLVDNSQRWWNPDLKEYPVELTLDHTPATFKPGMGVHTDVLVNKLTGVLAAPIPAIYSSGPDSYVFVRGAEDVRPVKVKLGVTNATHAEILDGLSAGDQVLVLQVGQGRELLEKAGIHVAPATQPSEHHKHKKSAEAKPTA
jgi:HlyD family secretion protein